MNSRFVRYIAVAAAVIAAVGTASAPAVADATQRPGLTLPELSVDASSGRMGWAGYSRLSTEVQATPNASSGSAIESIELVVPGSSDETVPAPAGGTGTVTFALPTAFPNIVDGYVVAIDDAGFPSNQVPVRIYPTQYSAHLAIDTGATTWDGFPIVKGDDARFTITPQWFDGPDQTDTWITGVSVDRNGPVGEESGLHETGPVSIVAHRPDGIAFSAGETYFDVCVTDNHGERLCSGGAMVVVNPVTASWTMGTTQPGVPTTVVATVHNTTKASVTSLVMRIRDGSIVATDPAPHGDTPSLAAPMTFDPGLNYPSVTVTMSDGVTYQVFDEIESLIPVTATLTPPADAVWGTKATFRVRTVNTQGKAQARLPVRLQSRAPGSSTWVSRASTTTDGRGKAVFSLATKNTGSASWRVVSARDTTHKASRSAAHAVAVRGTFGTLPSARTVASGHAVAYALIVTPARTGTRAVLQYRRSGTGPWHTLVRATVRGSDLSFRATLPHTGRYQLRAVVAKTRVVATTISHTWTLHVV